MSAAVASLPAPMRAPHLGRESEQHAGLARVHALDIGDGLDVGGFAKILLLPAGQSVGADGAGEARC